MTGIERLYKLIADIDVNADPELWDILRGGTEDDWDCEKDDDKTLDSTLAAIAIQIEREQGGRVSRMRVLSVVTEMERHVSGVEGMEDSPVARWARELREALGATVSRHESDGVANSPYDALRPEDREAIAWVREHGGLDAVKRRWECLSYYADPVPRVCMERRLARRQRQIDESHAALRRRNRRIAELEHLLCKEMSYSLRRDAGCLAPEALDAEGVEIRVGDTVYEVDTGEQMWVCALPEQGAYQCVKLRLINGMFKTLDPCRLTHQRPVLDADGEPLEVGQTVWEVDGTGHPFKVVSIRTSAGRAMEPTVVTCDVGDGTSEHFLPSQLTHTKPEPVDTWERIEEDSTLSPEVYCHRNGIDISQKDGTEIFLADTVEPMARDLVRRCRALAERERGEE